MPWYLTAYRTDRSPAERDGSLVGAYGGYLFARSLREARQIAKRRNIGEHVDGAIGSRKPNARLYTRPSEWLAKRRPKDADVFHSLCWIGHLALCSGVATPDEILGDNGLIHEYAHMRSGTAGLRKKLIAKAVEIEKRIPGFLPPSKGK